MQDLSAFSFKNKKPGFFSFKAGLQDSLFKRIPVLYPRAGSEREGRKSYNKRPFFNLKGPSVFFTYNKNDYHSA